MVYGIERYTHTHTYTYPSSDQLSAQPPPHLHRYTLPYMAYGIWHREEGLICYMVYGIHKYGIVSMV
jgi:hypothetical protein